MRHERAARPARCAKARCGPRGGDGPQERPHLPAREPFDRLAELLHGRVPEHHPDVVEALVLAHRHQVPLRRVSVSPPQPRGRRSLQAGVRAEREERRCPKVQATAWTGPAGPVDRSTAEAKRRSERAAGALRRPLRQSFRPLA
ncbi:MAG: hypothetical protein AVDCRST_MAG79-787 [uncultured Thermoleophilia bacterium]|uniref:Uncharacterized protein n=1 Tax=uncultured Thermoleophilia bacterium TaxID=1497501 RepID=A0A6J4TSU0_9ACTN|nr:MAG: hypothetical protein AVDCRST_MAG79-787 [uncultured Thermoleophilia bacterium]